MSLRRMIRARRWTEPRYPISNLSMDGHAGGRLNIPPHEYDAFLDNYAKDLAAGRTLYIVERPSSPHCRWYADLDVVAEREWDDDAVLAAVRAVQRALRQCMGDAATRAKILVLRAPPILKEGGVKNGIHLVAPSLRVTRDDCLRVREAAIAELARAGDAVRVSNGWEDALDAHVYNGSGLRMVGSHKMEPCRCDAGTDECARCGGAKRRDAGRPYGVALVVGSDGASREEECRRLRANWALAVRMTSIRCHDTLQSAPASRPLGVRSVSTDEIAALMAAEVHPCFATVEVTGVTAIKGSVILSLRDFRHCLNVGREHANAMVYLQLYASGDLVQRCYCGKHGCPAFRSKPARATSSLLRRFGLTTSRGLPLGFAAR